MTDRTVAPATYKISDLTLPTPIVHKLDNGIPVYEICMGTQDIVKVEIVFNSGRPFEEKKLVARATAALLKEGTKSRNSAEIAEKIDFYGGVFSVPINLDTSNIILYSLNKHFEKVLPIIAEIIINPIFPEKELAAVLERNCQRLLVDLTRSDVVAYRQFTEYVFGDNHPYGYNSTEEIYRSVTRDDLLEHHKSNYHTGKCKVFVSGKTDEKTIQLLNEYLGRIPRGETAKAIFPPINSKPKKSKILIKDSLQTAIRIGRRLFNRNHSDYNGIHVLSTILGGYFGSRLMTNIREDKGYTYNIFSSVDSMIHDGYFYIGTEVGNEFTEKAIKEIYHEIAVLQTELIGEEELEMVKNYLLGNMLTMLDGPFNVADVIKTFVMEDLPVSHFHELVKTIKNISPEEIRDLAKKYLNKEDLWEVIVGEV